MDLFENSQYKEMRLAPAIDGEKTISRKAYNLILGMTLFWGFLIDVIICIALYDKIFILNPVLVLVVYIVVTLASIVIIHKSDSAVISFGAFTALAAVMGLMVAIIVSQYTTGSVLDAFIKTAIVCLVVGLLSSAFPNFFLKMGRGLFIALVAVVLVEIVFILFTGGSPNIISLIVVLIFSGYFGYDLVKAQQYVPTTNNAVDSAADIYIDVINLFIRILSLLGERR